MNKKLFRYLFRSHRVAILFFLVLYVFAMYLGGNNLMLAKIEQMRQAIVVGIILTVGMCFVLPALLFSYVHARRSSDVYFALPVKRREQLNTNILFAFVIVFGYFLIGSLVIFILKGPQAMTIVRYLGLLGGMAAVSLALITMHSLFFLIANNLLDGLVMIGGYTVFPFVLLSSISSFLTDIVAGSTEWMVELWEYLIYLSPVGLSVSSLSKLISSPQGDLPDIIKYFAVLVFYILIACAGLKNEFINRNTERAEKVSDRLPAYPLVISMYLVTTLLAMSGMWFTGSSFTATISLYLMLFVVYTVATFVYRRRIAVEGKPIAIFAGAAVLTAALAYAGWSTKGFGLANRVSYDKDAYICVEYTNMVLKSDLGTVYGKEDRYENDRVAEVHFSLQLPVEEFERNTELKEIVDRYRVRAGEDFYRTADGTRTGWFSFYNCNKINDYGHSKHSNRHSYTTNETFSEEELKLIADYAEVYVYGHEEWEEISLNEYLERRN